MQRCRGVAEGVDGCSGGAEVQGRSARTDEAYSMRRTATEPRSRVTTAATRQLTHAAHACEALRRIQCAKTRRTAARICESAAACARHVESAPRHARAAGLVNSRAQPRARPATAATAAQVLQLRVMRHESMPRTAGASLVRTAALTCACACHRQSGWESRARRRSQAPRCSSAARFATSPCQAAKQRRATLIGLKASSSHAWLSRVGNGGTGKDGAAFRDFGPAFWRHPGLRGCCAALRRPWSLEPPNGQR